MAQDINKVGISEEMLDADYFLASIDGKLRRFKKEDLLKALLMKSGGTMAGAINMDGNAITGIPDAEGDTDALALAFAKTLFAPIGYGLGGNAKHLNITNISELDSIVANGWYSFAIPNGEWVNNVFVDYGYFRVDNYDETGVTQTIHVLNASRTILIRDTIGGVWGKWKSPNPPMQVGVEYLTTEIWRDKEVYVKVVDCGRMPNTTVKETRYNTNLENWGAIRCVGERNDGVTIPYDYADAEKASCYATNNNVIIRTYNDQTSYFATAQVWYVKYEETT